MKTVTHFLSANGDRSEEEPPSAPRNAFQVMMDSRNKIIGSNSPGKDLSETPPEERQDGEKLSARKKLFSGWARRKRTRDDEDRDEVIKLKMKKRVKRLKKLLRVEDESGCLSDDLVVRGKPKKKTRRLSTTSEDTDVDELAVPSSTSSRNLSRTNGVKDPLNFVTASENGVDVSPRITNEVAITTLSSKRRERRKKSCKSDRVSQGTPSKWRMKIKLNIKDDSDFETNDTNSKSDSDKGVISLSSGSDEDFQLKSQPTTPVKLAPVFCKSQPKPQLDPDVIKARRAFLMSGTPAILKKHTTEQKSLPEKEVEIFPEISHVQQRCQSTLWDLPHVQLQLSDETPLEVAVSDLTCIDLTCKSNFVLNIKSEQVNKVDKLKKLLDEIKHNNPDYPVYRSYRLLQEKSQKDLKTSKSKKRRPDDLDRSTWTEKYRPRRSDDILGNSEAVKGLKRWLEVWRQFGQEMNSKRKRRNSSSSDFESSDCDSRDSSRFQGNTMVLGGPCGSGKSSAVYAVCEGLGMKVIEVNASSKRTGKKLMQELQEATQSHQVRKNELSNFLDTPTSNQEHDPKPKMCVLLVEDIDIVFEQDEGFVCALNQLINTSKRPIIMTTSNHESVSMKKFVNDYESIIFSPLHSSTLATWLQILCLIEGRLVNRDDIGDLLDSNRGDIRRTLLELQFWVQSGGQLIELEHRLESCDENTTTSKPAKNNRSVIEHRHCIRTFQIFHNSKPFNVPYYLNLDFLYWNIPNILNNNNVTNDVTNDDTKLGRSFKTVIKLYDALCAVDVDYRRIDYFDWNEPMANGVRVKDSLELVENFDGTHYDREFVHELNHTLVDGLIKEYNGIENVSTRLDMAVPSKQQQRCQSKHQLYENAFKEAICTSSYLDRRSVSVDYLPALREISRAEIIKMNNNTKRHNRYRSYLRTLGVNCNESTMKLACGVLRDTYEISQSSLLSLKAEILRKHGELSKAKTENEAKIRVIKKNTPLEIKNKGVDARGLADVEEDVDLLRASKSSLEIKAALYDKLSSSEPSRALSSRYLVRFDRKNRGGGPPEGSDEEPDRYPESENERYESDDSSKSVSDEWVDYVDCLGRTRRCLRKDLETFKSKDRDLKETVEARKTRDPSPEPRKDPESDPEEYHENSELLSSDMRRELLRQQWEKEEEQLMDKSDVHYQDVLFGEARTHGVGYYGFSKDEDVRSKQQEALNKLRKETEANQKKAQELKALRERQLAMRIKAAKDRKRARLGLPPEEEVPVPAPTGPDPEEEKRKEEARKKEEVEKLLMEARKRHVRPWDVGKEGVPKQHYEMTQDEWVDKKRSERRKEFAPPTDFTRSGQKSSKREPQGVCKPPRTNFRSTPVVHEVDPTDHLMSDYISKQHSNSSNYNLKPQQTNFTSVPIVDEVDSGDLISDNISTQEPSDDDDERGKGAEVAPPSTFEYYGPSGSKRSKPYSTGSGSIEDSIEAGLQFLKQQVEKKQKRSRRLDDGF